jgi:hypothetical protein
MYGSWDSFSPNSTTLPADSRSVTFISKTPQGTAKPVMREEMASKSGATDMLILASLCLSTVRLAVLTAVLLKTPWLVLSNLDDFNQCTIVMAVSVFVIYRIRDFNLVFKLNTSQISTNHSTVLHTNFFPTNCTIHKFNAPTCFGHKPQPYSGGYST